jgi:protein-S-isoprenylcysteine O-methyltransferase Ste14
LSRLELALPPPVVMALAALLMWALPGPAFDVPAWPAAVVLFAASLAIGIGAFLQFRKARTTINPMKPRETSALVTNGFFAWSRNPIYVADALALVGIALLLANPVALVLVALFVAYIDRFQIRPEERALRARFAGEYENYCRKVRRWL